MIKTLIAKIPLFLSILTVGGTSFYSINKVLDTKPNLEEGVVPVTVVSENSDQPVTTTTSDIPITNENTQDQQEQSTTVAKTTTTSINNKTSTVGTKTFTLQDLSQHNNTNSCYIGFNGKVYNVTNTAS